jgi:VanZ family protein
MIRIVFTYFVPFVTPLIGWYVWVRFFNNSAPEASRWRKAPWHWLAIAGFGAVIAVLLATMPPGDSPDQVYEPAHVRDGKVIPGQYRPRDTK